LMLGKGIDHFHYIFVHSWKKFLGVKFSIGP